ncbi:MAG: hypothetical protein K0R18_498 [Bacillales bacterium]|nr:hypothetical protein [Bacillales bacterium]
MLHNAYSKDGFFLNRFLINNENNPVVLVSNETDKYAETTKNYEDPFEDDIERYIEEKILKEIERTQGMFRQREASDFDFTVFKKFIEEELTDIKNERAIDIEDRYINEGQKMFAKKILRMISEVEQKRRNK